MIPRKTSQEASFTEKTLQSFKQEEWEEPTRWSSSLKATKCLITCTTVVRSTGASYTKRSMKCAAPAERLGTAWTSARRPKTKYAALAVQRTPKKGIHVTQSVPYAGRTTTQGTRSARSASKRRTSYERDNGKESIDETEPANLAGTGTQRRPPFPVAAVLVGEAKEEGREIVRAPSPAYPCTSRGETMRVGSDRSTGRDPSPDVEALAPKHGNSQGRHPEAADTTPQEETR